jgi:hypothetical protein
MAVEENRTYPVEHLREFSARVFRHFPISHLSGAKFRRG